MFYGKQHSSRLEAHNLAEPLSYLAVKDKGFKEWIEKSCCFFGRDIENGIGYIWSPNALHQKFVNAGYAFRWCYVFVLDSVKKSVNKAA